MHLKCTEIRETIEEKVSKPVEDFEERQSKRCKKAKWWDPRKYICWLVTIVVKVVRWVVVTIIKVVVRTVCTVVLNIVDFMTKVWYAVWDILVGIFTLDWRRVANGFIDLFSAVVEGIFRTIHVLLAGDLIEFFIEEFNRNRLRKYVRTLLEGRFVENPETVDRIGEQIGLKSGAFGLKMRGEISRSYLDSETMSVATPGVPNLVELHGADNDVDLYVLCGFRPDPQGFRNQKGYKTLKKGPPVITGGGLGEFDNPISESELDLYLESNGADGPAFVVQPIRDGPLKRRADTAADKSRELGLRLSFDRNSYEVTEARHIVHPGLTVGGPAAQQEMLQDVVGRTDKVQDLQAARAELCRPVGLCVFRYRDRLRGLADPIEGTNCGMTPHDSSGVTFIDNRPETLWKYVPIHEFGHYFGLCHVSGVHRVMYSPQAPHAITGWTLPQLLWGRAEPYFSHGEAKQAWDYIVANFPIECFGVARSPGQSDRVDLF